jgi:hypothetical protein
MAGSLALGPLLVVNAGLTLFAVKLTHNLWGGLRPDSRSGR